MLKLSHSTIGRLSIGFIVNLASNDVQRFDLVNECIFIVCVHVLTMYIVKLAFTIKTTKSTQKVFSLKTFCGNIDIIVICLCECETFVCL